MNYRALSIVLAVCLMGTTALLWAQDKTGSVRFPANVVVQWPIPGSQAIAPGHVGSWNHPDSLDSVAVAPGNHKVLFENDRIRLLEVTLLAGEQEPLHGHKYPSVFALDAVQPALHDHAPDGTPISIPRGLVTNEFPACLSMGPQEPHAAQDVDTFPQHFYRLEFKKIYGKDIEEAHWTRNGNTIIHNQ